MFPSTAATAAIYGNTLGARATGDYSPSLRSPWLAAIDGEPSRQWLLDLHRFFGLSVLGLALTRMVLRPLLRTSQVNRGLPPLLARLAGLSHGGLYLLLVALPLLGWAQWSASGKPMQLFGRLSVPPLFGFGPDRDSAEALGNLHAGLAWLLIALVAAHALAALWHHFARRDQVLRSMLPEGGNSIPMSTPRRPLKPSLLYQAHALGGTS